MFREEIDLNTQIEAVENFINEAPDKGGDVRFFVMRVCLALCFTTVRCFIWIFDHPWTSLGLLTFCLTAVAAMVMSIGLLV